MRLRTLNFLAVPALALAAAFAAAPFAHAEDACRMGNALTLRPTAMATATATAPAPATALAAAGAPGMVQIPGLRPRGGCAGGHEFEGREHRFGHAGEDGTGAFRRDD